MQWLRLRPESPEELDMVDWRGRWINEDDEYDEEEEEEGGRQMEDFDPDAVDGEEEEEEDDEEEEEASAGVPMSGQQPLTQQASHMFPSVLSSLTSNYSARTSPTSVDASRSDLVIDLSVYSLPRFGHLAEGGKVKTVRQWAPRTEFGGTAQV